AGSCRDPRRCARAPVRPEGTPAACRYRSRAQSGRGGARAEGVAERRGAGWPGPKRRSTLSRDHLPAHRHLRPDSGPLDNLTHAPGGAAAARAGADRATPLATPTLIVAANAPDVDVLAYLGGPHFALAFRRGITHGWPAMLVLPFLVAGAFLWWDRRIRRRRDPSAPPAAPGALLLLAAVGVATHPLLDWMNTYGMRWGLPFDGSWSYGDTLFIIDPWIWLTLGG